MKTVTIRDLRQRWPETEAALLLETEILITRDAKPVARLMRYIEPEKPRQHLDPKAQMAWLDKTSGGKTVRWVEDHLLQERDEK